MPCHVAFDEKVLNTLWQPEAADPPNATRQTPGAYSCWPHQGVYLCLCLTLWQNSTVINTDFETTNQREQNIK